MAKAERKMVEEQSTEKAEREAAEREAAEGNEDLDLADLIADTVTLLCGKKLDGPTMAEVKFQRKEDMLSLSIHMKNPEDVGSVIGREGRTIKALQHIVRCIGGARGGYFNVDMADENRREIRDKA